MKGNSLKDNNHGSQSFFFNEDLLRLQNVLANDRSTIWNVDRNYHLLALQERLDLSDGDKNDFSLTQKILTPSLDKALSCTHKQSQHKICMNKPLELIQLPSPPPGFLLSSGFCCCMTYRNTNAECITSFQDELDINGIIKEFRSTTKIHEDYEHGLFSGATTVSSNANVLPIKDRKLSLEVTNKLLETSYLLFNILAEEVCFNDKLIKELCLHYVQSSRLRKRMSYTDFRRSEL